MSEKKYWENLKEKNPVKYRKMRDRANAYQRKYNKTYLKTETARQKSKEYNKKAYQKLKSDPIKYAEHKRKIKEYCRKKWKNDREFKRKTYEYQRNYMKKMKIENPEKYHKLTYHRFIQSYKTGLKCKGCGKGIKTNCAGHLGKRTIKCPFCGNYYKRNELEKVKIPRIFFGEKKETTDAVIEEPKMEITEKTLKNLKYFSQMVKKNTNDETKTEVGDDT